MLITDLVDLEFALALRLRCLAEKASRHRPIAGAHCANRSFSAERL